MMHMLQKQLKHTDVQVVFYHTLRNATLKKRKCMSQTVTAFECNENKNNTEKTL